MHTEVTIVWPPTAGVERQRQETISEIRDLRACVYGAMADNLAERD